MNWLDLTVSVFLVIALVNGYRKGLVMQLAELSAVVLAAIFGGKLADRILPELLRLFELSPNVARALSYIVAFIAIAIVISFIGRLIQKFLDAIFLSFINRLLGSIIAMGTTMILLSILLNLVLMLDPHENVIKKRIKEESFFFERVEAVVPAIVPYLDKGMWEEYVPEKYREEIESKSENLRPFLPDSLQVDSVYQQRYFDVD